MKEKRKNVWKKLLAACVFAMMLACLWSVSALASGFEEVESEEALLGDSVLKQTNGTTTSITVSWGSVGGAYSYVVGIADYNSSSNFALVGENITISGDTGSYTIKNLTAGKKYRVRVVANTGQYATITAKTVPGTVKNIQQYCYPSTKRMNFSWDRIESADGYEIYKYSMANKYLSRYAVSSTSKTIGLGTNFYSFRIRAYTYINGVKKNGKLYYLYTSLQPQGKTVYQTVGGTTAKITWSKITGATNYQVYRATSKNGTYKKIATVTGTQATITGLTKGKTYWFVIRATRTVNGKTWRSPQTYTYYFTKK